ALAGRVVVRPRDALRRVGDRRSVPEADEGEPAVVPRVGFDRRDLTRASPLRPHGGGAGQHHEPAGNRDDDAGRPPRHFFFSSCWIARVFSARSVTSFSSSCSYAAASMLALRPFSALT